MSERVSEWRECAEKVRNRASESTVQESRVRETEKNSKMQRYRDSKLQIK